MPGSRFPQGIDGIENLAHRLARGHALIGDRQAQAGHGARVQTPGDRDDPHTARTVVPGDRFLPAPSG